MVPALARVVLALLAAPAAAASARPRGREAGSLLQTWSAVLDAGGETPLAKVVGLLKSMQETLEKEMDEDQKLYEKLKCWCETNDWEKGNAIEDNKAKIEQLTADIESLSAKKEELIATIKEVQEKTAANKQSLAEAQAIRDKQLKEFHAMELDSIQALEQMKAALTILGKHHGEGVFQQFSPLSLLSVGGRDEPWTAAHDRATVGRALDEFMRRNDFGLSQVGERAVPSGQLRKQDTLAADGVQATGGWSADEAAVVRRALKAGSAFVQSHHEQSYYPSYTAQSGEIVGILKQLKDEMEADLGESQKQESMRSEEFQILRNAKTAEIEAGEKMEEQKEDELAKTANDLAEAKEDLGQEKALLSENQAFLKNMKETCAEADKNWEQRKKARQDEMEAVAETIAILTEDEAKDAAAGTYSFVQQRSSARAAEGSQAKGQRRAAAALLRRAALQTQSPELAMLATTVELDAFEKVKKAIDDMIVMLKKQMEDEVKKNDWCKAEFKENEMSTMKTEDLKADLAAHIAELENTIKTLEQEIAAHRKELERAQAELQGAGLSRKAENLDYQTTVADQTATIAVLKKALTRLSKYYASEALLQRRAGREDPAPGSVAPVAQMTYKASEGASGVMQMLEKLIVEAKALMAESKKSESEAQKAYETVIADTNAAVVALQKQITTKTKVKAKTTKEKQRTEEDLAAAVSELEGLNKYKADLHAECDFSLHNFDTRQDSRGQEIEALQQAKQILNGASLS
mmetsp:Transcript_9495/g.21854  ORF Transcript_9495/g.21854 Transcript_9495/m.21854 type:complete len:750 (+) Transcript_9495:68-2317(+)